LSLTGVVGLCLVIGGQRHFEQTFQLQGASSALAVVGTLATLALILPNYTLSALGPFYSTAQLMFVGALSLALWCIFVFVQAVKHRNYFLEPGDGPDLAHEKPSDMVALLSLTLLLVTLTAVVLLAKVLSYPLDMGIAAVGLPQAFVGVIIASIVLLPESLAAAKSALLNRLQNSINLSIGSAIASIGLTISDGRHRVAHARPEDRTGHFPVRRGAVGAHPLHEYADARDRANLGAARGRPPGDFCGILLISAVP